MGIKQRSRPLARIIRNCFRFLRDMASINKLFVRLTPWAKGRILFWSKISNSVIVLHSRHEADSSVLDSIFLNLDYDFSDLPDQSSLKPRYTTILESGKQPLIVDCGANIGASCVYFNHIFPDAIIIGVELEPENSTLAEKNTRHEKNIQIFNNAIGPTNGLVSFSIPNPEKHDGFRVDTNADGGIDIAMITVDELLALHQNATPFIAKIDIEGFEKELFTKNLNWMNDFHLISIEIHDWMLPGQAISAPFFRAHASLERDLYIKEDKVLSVKNQARGPF